MKIRKLVFCLMISVMLTVTFIPMLAFAVNDEMITDEEIAGISFEQKEIYQLRAGLDEWTDENGVRYWNVPPYIVGDRLTVTTQAGETFTYEYRIVTDEFDGETYGCFVNVDNEEDLLYGLPQKDECWAPVENHPAGSTAEINMTYMGHTATAAVAFLENPYGDVTIDPSEGIRMERVTAKNGGIESFRYMLNWEGTLFTFTKGGETVTFVVKEDTLYNEETGEWLAIKFIPETIGKYYDEESGQEAECEVGKDYTIKVVVVGIEKSIGITVVEHEHTLTLHPKRFATCAEIGEKEHWECSKCGQWFLDADGAQAVDPSVCYIFNPQEFRFAAATYNGKAQTPKLTVIDSGGNEIDATNYSVKYSDNTYAGTAKATVSFDGEYYSGTEDLTFRISKANQSMTVKPKTKTLKVKRLKKKAQTVSVLTVSKQGGSLTYKKQSGSSKLKINAKTGKVTVAKKTKKGTYKMKAKVTSAANRNYKAASKVVTVTVKVK